VVCKGWTGRWSGEDSSAEEELLQQIDLTFEKNDIEGSILRAEGIFDVFRDLRMFKDSPVGSFGIVISSSELACDADFFLEFHDREKEVVVEAEPSIECVQEG